MKKTKKNLPLPPVMTPKSTISFVAIIFFGLLLAATAFAAGMSWAKSRLSSTAPTITAKTAFAAQKSDTPELKFFVMSFCPYGNQIEEALKPVADLFGQKVTLRPQYIFSKVTDLKVHCQQTSGDPAQCAAYVQSKYFPDEASCQQVIGDNLARCLDEKNYIKSADNTLYAALHGRQEANQNVRELCAFNLATDKSLWWTFIDNTNKNCTDSNADTCWTDQAKKAGLDTDKITECFNKEGIALIEKEIATSDQFKAYSSPTVIVNDQNFPPEAAWDQTGQGSLSIGKNIITQDKFRTAESLKQAICASFKKAPSECKQVLPDVGSQAVAAGAGC